MPVPQIQVTLAVLDDGDSRLIAQYLMEAGAAVSIAHLRSADPLIQQMRDHVPGLFIVELLDTQWKTFEAIRAGHPNLPVVLVITRPEQEKRALMFHANTKGVKDIWRFPADADILRDRIRAVVRNLRPAAHHTLPCDSDADFTPSGPVAIAPPAGSAPALMTGDNPRMAEIRDTIEKVSGTDVTVLIRGESGVGKEVAARMIFENSRRRLRPFIKVNCAAIPHELLESELFGYEPGAFTGANRSKPGKFELADGGTLFLDEIAEMDPSLQAKLLHVLQDGKFSRLGARRDVSVNVRIVCATNKLLEERVREGTFREDLLYRINVVTIFLPPLRERRDEIPVLTHYLLRKYADQYGRTLEPLSDEVSRRMMQYDWPGNIRELENLCKRFVLVGSETQILRELSSHSGTKVIPFASPASAEMPRIAAAPAPPPAPAPAPPPAARSLLEIGRRAAFEAERRAIIEALEITRWNRREAARRLQVSYKALLNKIKQMNLEEMDDAKRQQWELS